MTMIENTPYTRQPEVRKRWSLLNKIQKRLEIPMLVLSFIWLILMILELTSGLSPFLMNLNDFIWFLFVIDFTVQFFLAPSKKNYLKRSWVTAFALILPVFRLLRIFRAFRLLRTLRLARVLTSLNRGIGALGKSLSRRGFGYVMILTVLVMLGGAAGILSFEKDSGVIADYGSAVWWTAMTLTTMGTDYFPVTSEGRFLCLLIAVYGFAIFGYVTAAVATFFVGREAKKSNENEAENTRQAIEALSEQIKILNERVNDLGAGRRN